MGPGVIVLQVKSCLLLWPDFGRLSHQPGQHHDVAVRGDDISLVSKVTELAKENPGELLQLLSSLISESDKYLSLDK